MSSRPDPIAAAVVGWTAVTVVAVFAGAPDWIRTLTAVPFVLVITGLGWAAALTRERSMLVAAAIAISISAAMLIGEIMALTDRWSPGLGIVALAVVAVAGAAVQQVRPAGRGPAGDRAAAVRHRFADDELTRR